MSRIIHSFIHRSSLSSLSSSSSLYHPRRHSFQHGSFRPPSLSRQSVHHPLLQVCTYINGILATIAQTCVTMGSAVCGDGNRAYGGAEACDDGNTISGDGCNSKCELECGYHCSEDSSGRSTCAAYCGNGVVDVLNDEECDDDSACCSNCRLVDGATCSGGECCSGCQFSPSTQSCGSSGGFCGPEGVCTPSLCYNFNSVTSCERDASAPCHEHCTISGRCIDLTTLLSPASTAYVAPNTPCTTAGGTSGRCDAAGECVSISASCGNGVVEVGEECDDSSACCQQSTCLLAAGAACSGGECCDVDCSFKTAATACNNGGGYCNRGVCDSQHILCSFQLDGNSATLDTSVRVPRG